MEYTDILVYGNRQIFIIHRGYSILQNNVHFTVEQHFYL